MPNSFTFTFAPSLQIENESEKKKTNNKWMLNSETLKRELKGRSKNMERTKESEKKWRNIKIKTAWNRSCKRKGKI